MKNFTLVRCQFLVSLLLLSGVSGGSYAQDIGAQPVYGTGNLDNGFLPDPMVIQIQAGGRQSLSGVDSSCVGFISSDQPSYDLNYTASTAELGFFVHANSDTALIVNDPNGDWHCNDDSDYLSDSNPGIFFNKPLSGNYNIWVASYSEINSPIDATLVISEYDEAEWANLSLTDSSSRSLAATDQSIDFGDNSSEWANDDECDDPRFVGENMASTLIDDDILHDASDCESLFNRGLIRLVGGVGSSTSLLEQGALETTDNLLDDGSYYDSYNFTGQAGEEWIIDLRSAAFDTFVQVLSPSGESFSNDDHNNSMDRSLLSMTLAESGNYEVRANSYAESETGSYTLSIARGEPSRDNNRSYTGRLEAGDSTFSDGEYYDTYSFTGQPGQRVSIDLSSDDFDTFLVLRSPDGESQSNDDAGGTNQSRLDLELSAHGTYEVNVTSFAAEEVGNYSLVISDDATSSGGNTSTSSSVVNLTLGTSINGELVSSDSRSDDQNYQDSYSFSAQAGENIRINMISTEVDSFLRVITPNGDVIENDDHEGDITQSIVDITARESGRYRVIATSYGSGETGAYLLAVNEHQSESTSATVNASSDGQIFGVFAGIADYPGTDSDLPLTDQDARRARDALISGAGMRPENATTLLNEDATMANFEAALDRFKSVAGPEDTLVIFYSGHGSRQERADGPDSKDPDGIDETIVLYDQQLTDDRLAQLLDQLDVGKVLLVMDSCFSGGFAKDVVSVPGRMGLFSSEEDVLSQVATKFQAGGYLSVFFEEALTEPYADRDENGELTAIELSQYIHDRFRADVKSFGTDEYVRASGPQANYQRLVVDRGGVGPYNVLFTRH